MVSTICSTGERRNPDCPPTSDLSPSRYGGIKVDYWVLGTEEQRRRSPEEEQPRRGGVVVGPEQEEEREGQQQLISVPFVPIIALNTVAYTYGLGPTGEPESRTGYYYSSSPFFLCPLPTPSPPVTAVVSVLSPRVPIGLSVPLHH